MDVERFVMVAVFCVIVIFSVLGFILVWDSSASIGQAGSAISFSKPVFIVEDNQYVVYENLPDEIQKPVNAITPPRR